MEESKDLLQDFGESRLVDLNELLQFVKIVAEETEPFIESHVAGRELRRGCGSRLETSLLVLESAQTKFELCWGQLTIKIKKSSLALED